MPTLQFESKWNAISFILFLVFMGLFFQVAWQFPISDSFPLIERLLDPQYLLNDFHTNSLASYSPRLATAQIIVAVSKLTGIHYTELVAYANVLRIWLYGVGLYMLFVSLSDKKTALIGFAFAALSFLSMPFMPAWWPISYDFTSSNIAAVAALFGWVFAVRGKVPISLILFSFTVYIHPVVGMHAVLIGMLLFLSQHSWKSFLDLFKQPLVYVASACFGAAFLYNFISYEQVLEDARFIEINAVYRHGHHFLFDHMDIEKWFSMLLMMAITAGLSLWFRAQQGQARDRFTLPVIAYALFMIGLGYLFINLNPSRFAVSFIPLRAFPILIPVILLAVARFAVWKWNKHDYTSFFLLFLPFIPYQHVNIGLTWFLLPDANESVLSSIVTLVVFTATVVTEFKPQLFAVPNRLLEALFKKSSIGVFILPIAVFSVGLSVLNFNFNIPTLDNSPALYSWLAQNTGEQEIVLAELDAADNQKLRMVARRGVVASKDFPFNEHSLEEWYQRYSSVYLHPDEAQGQVDAKSEDELNQLMDKYGATILLRTVPLEQPRHFVEIATTEGENGPTIVYKNRTLDQS